ncbi:hypothetical protein GIB67_001101 [Kingdonia uniflora]|uniref:galactinol--sucrose galactosyltransferase n=1 Tax=Kingdonia uniflora TaxID=39325 RepID=A0A7J7MGL7_9MAGN|nr:hypothetical protein GIB67_001101 [Kingdonia uniflora]
MITLSLKPNSNFSFFQTRNRRFFSNGYLRYRNVVRQSIPLRAKPVIKDDVFKINGQDVLTSVPDNVTVTPFTDTSAFVGATSTEKNCRHVFKLGVLQFMMFVGDRDVRLLCLFRFKMWWMIPRMGNSGSDVPVETQMLLLELREDGGEVVDSSSGSVSYVLFLPVLDGEFRSSLQGNSANELEFCVESGDPTILTSQSLKAIFVNHGNSPFKLMKESMKLLEKHMGTFALRETKKQTPGMLDWFGWCTWDAFYHKVNPHGIKIGLKRMPSFSQVSPLVLFVLFTKDDQSSQKNFFLRSNVSLDLLLFSLSDGGTPAKFLIIDDGWQDVDNEFQKEGGPFVQGSQFGGRLVSIKENEKFRKNRNASLNEEPSDLKDFVSDIKRTFGLRYVYVWHALMGYWGGVHPDKPETKKYNSSLRYPVQSPGVLSNMRDISLDCMEKYGVGIVDPAKIFEFYDDLHRYLVSQDVDGVKVDVQNILETVAAGLGGRVLLTRTFQQALEKSIAANFQENDIICCMGQSTDSVYHSKRSAITRASDDYWPKDPASQTLHVAAVAFNSIFLGEVVVPDWDMFYSQHYAAEFHAAARAVGGCGIYVRYVSLIHFI